MYGCIRSAYFMAIFLRALRKWFDRYRLFCDAARDRIFYGNEVHTNQRIIFTIGILQVSNKVTFSTYRHVGLPITTQCL